MFNKNYLKTQITIKMSLTDFFKQQINFVVWVDCIIWNACLVCVSGLHTSVKYKTSAFAIMSQTGYSINSTADDQYSDTAPLLEKEVEIIPG